MYIRHGQASYMSDNYDQLSDLGYEQGRILGRYLLGKNITFDKVYIGPLKRHQQTFDMVQEEYEKVGKEIKQVEYLQMLDEHRAPQALKQSYDQLSARYPNVKEWLEKAKSNPDHAKRYHLKLFDFFMRKWATNDLDIEIPSDIQDWQSFKTEVQKGIDHIVKNNGKGLTIGAFTSGGTISAASAYALDMQDDERIIELNGIVKNTSITEYLFSNGKISLHNFNTIPHLVEEHLITFV